jgi:hypothetical protein
LAEIFEAASSSTPKTELEEKNLSSGEVVTATPEVQADQISTAADGLRVCPSASRHLYFSFVFTPLMDRSWLKSGAAIIHAQAYIPAQPASPLEDPRISHAYEDQERPGGDLATARQGPQAGFGETRFP